MLSTGDAVLIAGIGAVVVLVAWLPLALKRLPLSVPIVCVAIGWGAAELGLLPFRPHPVETPAIGERITEVTLLISLMGSGLKIDRPLSLGGWQTTWRLLGIGMPLAILMLVAASLMLGFAWPTALLLAAVLTPTDPVLASDVEVGPPRKGEEGEIRFGLTSEALLNDGLALPFVLLAVALNAGNATGAPWLAQHFLWEPLLGAAIGWSLGYYVFGWLTFHLPGLNLSRTGDGLVALGVTFVAYGVLELAGGNGFVAVVATSLGLRAAHPDHKFHNAMSDFMGQAQRLLMMFVLVLLGAAVSAGLLAHLTWRSGLLALGLVFVVRPACAWLALIGSPHTALSRALTAFFGIRGIGSLYYLAFAMAEGHWTDADELGGLVTLAVLTSIVVHGLSVTPLMRWADRFRTDATRSRTPR